MTLGDLRTKIYALNNIPDDTIIVSYHGDMERNGYLPSFFHPEYRKANVIEKHTWDRFDGTDYTYKAYELKEDGAIGVIVI